MRLCMFVCCACMAVAASTANAHGPQIQVTNDGGKIVTRQIYGDGPYYTSLSPVTNVYVMPLMDFGGVQYSRPNTAIDPILETPAFPTGPGLAYGYDLADGGPQLFATGSVLTVSFTTPLSLWNGAAFGDAGGAQLKALRGSNVNITSPPENFAITANAGPFDSLSLAAVAANYGADGPEVHSSLRFAMLGNGTDPLSATADGIYMVGMQLSSSQSGLAPSDTYYFVLYKNASLPALTAAVNSLGAAPGAIQWTAVPEPSLVACLGIAVTVAASSWRPHRRWDMPL